MIKNIVSSIIQSLGFRPAKLKFSRLPFPLLSKCVSLLLIAVFMLAMGITVAVYNDNYKAVIAGAGISLTFIFTALYHAYLFTRKKYVRIFAFVARRERIKKLSREQSTFILLPDGSERELMLGKRKLNIGGEYAFYFGQLNDTDEPNINILYGYESADSALAHDEKLRSIAAGEETDDAALTYEPDRNSGNQESFPPDNTEWPDDWDEDTASGTAFSPDTAGAENGNGEKIISFPMQL